MVIGATKVGLIKYLFQSASSSFKNHLITPKTSVFFVRKTPDIMGQKFGPILKAASQRGPAGVAATHYTLMQKDPKYREEYEKVKEKEK